MNKWAAAPVPVRYEHAAPVAGTSPLPKATVALLAILAAKPLSKGVILIGLALFLFVGAISSGFGVLGGALLAFGTILFILVPRRR